MELVRNFMRDWIVEDGEETLKLLGLLPQSLLLVDDGREQGLEDDSLLLLPLGGDHVKDWHGIETGNEKENDDHNPGS